MKLDVTDNEVNLIMTALLDLPAKMSMMLIQKVQVQMSRLATPNSETAEPESD
jgi:hypothetical protein